MGIGTLYVDVSMLKTFKVDKKFHGLMLWIEKSVMRVTDRHHEACPKVKLYLNKRVYRIMSRNSENWYFSNLI